MTVSPGFGVATLSVVTLILVGAVISLGLARVTRVGGAVRITATSYVAHLVVSLTVYGTLGIFANDGFGYDSAALSYASVLGGDTTATVITESGKQGWVWILGHLYYYFGHQPLLGVILNAAMAACIVPVVGAACENLGWSGATRVAMWLAGFAPPLFIWSTFLLRESSINLTVSVTFAACTKFLSSRRWRWLALALVLSVPLALLRGSLVVVVDVGLILGIVLTGRIEKGRMTAARAIGFGVVTLLAVPISLLLLGQFANTSLANINASRVALAQNATTSFGAVAAPTSLGDSVLLAVQQLPTSALGPFPWQWTGGFGGLLTASDGATALVFAWLISRAWRKKGVPQRRWICVMPALLLLLTIAATSGNFGTLVRIRAMIVPFLAPLVASGIVAGKLRLKAHEDTAVRGRKMVESG